MKTKSQWIEKCQVELKSDHVRGHVSFLPGNSNVLISHDVYCDYKEQGKGHGDRAHKERLAYMKDQLGASYVICTVASDNEPQIKIMNKNGWKKIDQFFDDSYEHDVFIFGKNLLSTIETDIPDYGTRESDI